METANVRYLSVAPKLIALAYRFSSVRLFLSQSLSKSSSSIRVSNEDVRFETRDVAICFRVAKYYALQRDETMAEQTR